MYRKKNSSLWVIFLTDYLGNIILSLFSFSHQVSSSQGLLQGLVWSLELGSTVATKKGKLVKQCVTAFNRRLAVVFVWVFSLFCVYLRVTVDG